MNIKPEYKLSKQGPGRRQGGISLVEILVASALLSFAIIAVVALVRKGSELDTTDLHRRVARSIINSRFESRDYHFTNYELFENREEYVTIDPYGPEEGDDLTGMLTIAVTDESTQAYDGTVVPYKKVAISVSWQEPDGESYSISMEKRIAR